MVAKEWLYRVVKEWILCNFSALIFHLLGQIRESFNDCCLNSAVTLRYHSIIGQSLLLSLSLLEIMTQENAEIIVHSLFKFLNGSIILLIAICLSLWLVGIGLQQQLVDERDLNSIQQNGKSRNCGKLSRCLTCTYSLKLQQNRSCSLNYTFKFTFFTIPLQKRICSFRLFYWGLKLSFPPKESVQRWQCGLYT